MYILARFLRISVLQGLNIYKTLDNLARCSRSLSLYVCVYVFFVIESYIMFAMLTSYILAAFGFCVLLNLVGLSINAMYVLAALLAILFYQEKYCEHRSADEKSIGIAAFGLACFIMFLAGF